jgi:hypothetical protein
LRRPEDEFSEFEDYAPKEVVDHLRATSPTYRSPTLLSRGQRDEAIRLVLERDRGFFDREVTAKLIPDSRFSAAGCSVWGGRMENGSPVVDLPADIVINADGSAVRVGVRRVVAVAHGGGADGAVTRTCPCGRERCVAIPGLKWRRPSARASTS